MEKADFELIKKFFNITEQGVSSYFFSYPGSEMLNPKTVKEILNRSEKGLKAHGLELPVSFIGNAFFGIIATQYYLISKRNKLVDFSLKNLDFQAENRQNHIHSAFKWKHVSLISVPAHGRTQFLIRKLNNFFKETITPIIETVAKAANVKPSLIWNQYPSRMTYVFEYLQKNEFNEDVKRQFVEDYETFCRLNSELFHLSKNPFIQKTAKYVDDPYNVGNQMLIRSACCMYYKRDNGVYCYNCPKLTDEERDTKKREITLKQNVTKT